MANPPPAKLSFKLGGGTSKKQSLPTLSRGPKRPLATLHAGGRHDDDEPTHEEITHYDSSAGGAFHESKKKDDIPRIIPYHKRKRGNISPRPETYSPTPQAHEALEKETEKQYGLIIRDDKPTSVSGLADTQPQIDTTSNKTSGSDRDVNGLNKDVATTTSARDIPHAVSEREAFSRDSRNAPPAPTEADYDEVPVEGFGAAILRGMGWKDGEAVGRRKDAVVVQINPRERRPDLLGVGAKPAAAVGVELGAWGKKARSETSYNPVVLRNKDTGEEITQQEYEERIAKDADRSRTSKDDGKKDSSAARDRHRDSRRRSRSRNRYERDERQLERRRSRSRDRDARDRRRTDSDRRSRSRDRSKERSRRKDHYRSEYEELDRERSTERHRRESTRLLTYRFSQSQGANIIS